MNYEVRVTNYELRMMKAAGGGSKRGRVHRGGPIGGLGREGQAGTGS